MLPAVVLFSLADTHTLEEGGGGDGFLGVMGSDGASLRERPQKLLLGALIKLWQTHDGSQSNKKQPLCSLVCLAVDVHFAAGISKPPSVRCPSSAF